MTDDTTTIPKRPARRVIRRPRLAGSSVPAPAPTITAAADPAELLTLAATCPRCGARPALRATRSFVAALASLAAEHRVGTYQCQRRGCGMVYDLTARVYHAAAPPRERAPEPPRVPPYALLDSPDG